MVLSILLYGEKRIIIDFDSYLVKCDNIDTYVISNRIV